jgi:two-component system phosphate regulon sensor histidine kinase PhoR
MREDSLTLLKKGTDASDLNKSKYRTLLFPEEVFSGINELRVYFPNKNRLILGSLVGMLTLSIGFILLIVGVFLKAVQMFIRQKKITDVKNDLINNITHEFKTPISTISLACEALNEPALSSEKQSVARYSKIIKEENERLQLMVDTLLNTASMERDEITIEKKEVDLKEIAVTAASKFDEAVKQREGFITIDASDSNYIVIGDKFHLSNVTSNLIDNAIKFNEKTPEVNINLTANEQNIFLTITDNGIGVPKESLTKIFETFYRVQSGNIQNVRGNGIGLSYAKKIVELHGGTITVESQINVGSSFKITFPTK